MSRQILMPGQTFAVWILALVLAAFASAPGPALAAKALLNVDVPPAKWKAMRLKNLPRNASLGARIEASGSIDVILVHGDELKRFPAAVNPEFLGSVERTLSFSVSVPRAGDYFLILDNRQNKQMRKVRILIRAERGGKSGDSGKPAEAADKKTETEI